MSPSYSLFHLMLENSYGFMLICILEIWKLSEDFFMPSDTFIFLQTSLSLLPTFPVPAIPNIGTINNTTSARKYGKSTEKTNPRQHTNEAIGELNVSEPAAPAVYVTQLPTPSYCDMKEHQGTKYGSLSRARLRNLFFGRCKQKDSTTRLVLRKEFFLRPVTH